ncbi:hypothetical protein BDZ91DRAFT_750496, partial [Kalaharituber pfeilii]
IKIRILNLRPNTRMLLLHSSYDYIPRISKSKHVPAAVCILCACAGSCATKCCGCVCKDRLSP